METKINIAEILKDKPQRTILYDYLHNIDVEFDNVEITEIETSIWCTRDKGGYNELFGYSKLGTLRGWLDGLQILLPSKEMRDWSKFAWKKGDVLVSTDRNVHIIFEKFEDDAYTKFRGKHYLWEEGGSMVSFEENECYMQTSDFNKANKEDAQEYIHKIEKELGGKLNRETLEIEKVQPEFKDGDIAFADYGNRQYVFIVSGKTNLSEGYNSFISLDLSSLTLSMGYITKFFKEDLCKLRLATEEEKKQFFSALKKEGKRWDSEKKEVVDLKPNVELKPFDKVLVRDFSNDKWSISFFSFKKEDCYVCINHCSWNQCIPYIGNESLLGTTKDVEG